VIAHRLGRDPGQAFVERRDVELGLRMALLGIERRVAEQVAEERVVDLQQEAGSAPPPA